MGRILAWCRRDPAPHPESEVCTFAPPTSQRPRIIVFMSIWPGGADGGNMGRILELVLLFKDLCRCKDHEPKRDTLSRLFSKIASQTVPNVFPSWNITSLG